VGQDRRGLPAGKAQTFYGLDHWLACAIVLLAALALPLPSGAASVVPAGLVFEAPQFARDGLTDGSFAERIRKSGSLGGGAGSCCITGWVEYDVLIPVEGWYELSTVGAATGTGFLVYPADSLPTSDRAFAFHGGTMVLGQEDRIGVAWFDVGPHRIRVSRFYWTGFPQITRIQLRPAGAGIQDRIHLSLEGDRSIFRLGQCAALQIRYGPLLTATALELRLRVRERWNQPPTRTVPFTLPPTAKPTLLNVGIPCDQPGSYFLGLGRAGHDFSSREVRWIAYEVHDTASRQVSLYGRKRRLIADIDATSVPPEYSGGATRLTTTTAGTYRESGDTGFTRFQRTPPAARSLLQEPSWFAYRVPALTPQRPYLVEVEYPDDALRTFAVMMRESAPLDYPVSIGIDTGGDLATSGRMQRRAFIYWPRSPEPRLVVATAHDGRRAALARIRIWSLDDTETDSITTRMPANGRQFAHWYEEGLNFLSLFGAPDRDAVGQRVAIDRWFDVLASEHIGTVMPTVLVYSFALYPSKFNLAFSGGTDADALQRMLLAAERRRLRVIPEFHPRADELLYSLTEPRGDSRLLLSKDGGYALLHPDGRTRRIPPYFNPINARVQDWYVSMIGEMADRYAESPALGGVSLRLMDWFNGALNNFVSLDWGYDAATIARFQRDTGLMVPTPGDTAAGDSPGAAKFRFHWLTSDAKRRQVWLQWRADQITRLIERIRDRVKQARSDLVVYLNVFDTGHSSLSVREALLQRGIDVDRLARTEGIRLINSLHGYGRREGDLAATMADRERLVDPLILGALRHGTQPGHHLASARYIEMTDAVIPPARLGFPAETRRTWASMAMAPSSPANLERFAIPLAETDAQFLGDGGNQYVFGDPQIREFAREFRFIPAVAFRPDPSARDPVALWSLTEADGMAFYVVNRERWPVRVTLRASGAGALHRPSDGSSIGLSGKGVAEITLPPHALRFFRARKATHVELLSTSLPPEAIAHAKALSAWVTSRAERATIGQSKLDSAGRARLASLASEVQAALASGETWRARTLFERSALLPIYQKLDDYPPGWVPVR
jgi:hypothetical protein